MFLQSDISHNAFPGCNPKESFNSVQCGPKCHKRHENVTLQNAEKFTQQNNTPEETPQHAMNFGAEGIFAYICCPPSV